MPNHPPRRLIQGQGGSTLIELLVAMPIALLLLGLVVQALGDAGTRQRDIEQRTETLTGAQLGLDRMTRELREARWVYFRSSAKVDLLVGVRSGPTTNAALKLVRYDCSGDTCDRSEGGPVDFPPPATPTFTKTQVVLGVLATTVSGTTGQVVGHDVFYPSRVDPQTGLRSDDFANPDYMLIRLRMKVKKRGEHVELSDGVSLRNRTNYAS